MQSLSNLFSLFFFMISKTNSPYQVSKFKDNFSSESFYPDSNYYLDQDNSSKDDLISKDLRSNMGGDFKWPNTYWFIAERTNGRLAMIGFMAVIINYTLFGWIAYPIL